MNFIKKKSNHPKMVVAKVTVESRVDVPCTDWIEGGEMWDVMVSLDCDASDLQS